MASKLTRFESCTRLCRNPTTYWYFSSAEQQRPVSHLEKTKFWRIKLVLKSVFIQTKLKIYAN